MFKGVNLTQKGKSEDMNIKVHVQRQREMLVNDHIPYI